MLFKNYIYINEELLTKLSKQIGINISYDTTRTNQVNKKGGLNIGNLSVGADSTKTDTEKYLRDKYDLLRDFESELSKDETGIVEFDFDDADHIIPGQLIRISAKMIKPSENVENLDLINAIKQNKLLSKALEDSVNIENTNEKNLFDTIMNSNSSIPIYFSNDEKYIIVSNIYGEKLEIEYENFQDLYGEEVKAIVLVDRKYSEQQEVVIVDFMKDIFKIGREFRRTMPKSEQEKYIISEKGPAIKGEILAIYN